MKLDYNECCEVLMVENRAQWRSRAPCLASVSVSMPLLCIYGSACVRRLQCQFVDIPSSMMINAYSRFHGDQIALAMHHLIVMMKQRPMTSSSPWTTVTDAVKPDIRLNLVAVSQAVFMSPLHAGIIDLRARLGVIIVNS